MNVDFAIKVWYYVCTENIEKRFGGDGKMKKLDSLFSSRGFRVVALSCGTVFLVVAAIFLFLFFRSGGFDILFAKATDFEMVMSENEHVFDKVGDKFVLLAYTEPDDGLEIGFSSTNEEIVNVTSDGTVTAVKSGVAAVKASCTVKGEEVFGVCVITVNDAQPSGSGQNAFGGDEGYVPEIPEAEFDSDGFLSGDNFFEYYQMNSDTVAWLHVPGTNINLPVAQPPMSDPEYYLTHGLNRYQKYSGSAFVDASSKLSQFGGFVSMSELNTVVYGHARGNDVFDQLEKNLVLSSWFENTDNRYVYVNTATELTKWEIFAVYYTDFAVEQNKTAVTRRNYMLTAEQLRDKYSEEYLSAQALAGNLEKLMLNGSEMAQVANSWRDRMDTKSSLYGSFSAVLGARDWGVSVDSSDRIISLVTCADSNTDVRFVVQAKLVASKDRNTGQITKYGG